MKFIFLLLLSTSALAQTIYLPNIKSTETGTTDSGLASANVHITNATLPGPTGGATAANQTLEITALNGILGNQTNGTQEVSQFGTWSVGRTWTLNNSTDSVSAFTKDGSGNAIASTLGALDVFISGGSITATNPSVGANGSAAPASSTQVGGSDGTNLVPIKVSSAGVVSVNGSAFTQPVSASALPLPANAAKETGGNLDSILASQTSGAQKTQVTNFPAVQPVSGTVSILSPLNNNASGSSAGATVSTVTTLTSPANAVGFVLMNLDTSTTNMRWAVGRAASTTLGQQLQPGRSSDFVPYSGNVSIIAESGTCNYDIQWVSQ